MPFFDLTNVHNYIVYNLASKELELVFEPIVSISFFKRDFFLSPGHDRVVTIKSRNFFYCESLVLSGFLY